MSAPVTGAHQNLAGAVWSSVEYHKTPHAAQLIADSEAKATERANAQVESLISSAKNAIPASEHPAESTVENWAWQMRNLGDDRRLVAAERDQLRAEVERLKKQIEDDNRSYGCELRDAYGTIWEQATKDHDRAGKAERALAELREWQAGVIANERLHHAERKEAIARAERAEAKVSNQAERIRYLEGATNHASGTPLSIAIARAERAEREVADLKANNRFHRGHSAGYAEAKADCEAELAAERTRLDWLMAGGVCMVQHSGGFYVSRLHAQVSRAAIDAAMKEGA